MKLTSGVGVVKIETAPAAEKHVSTQSGDSQTGEDSQPRVKLLGHDVSRSIEGDGAKSKDSRGMRSGDDEPQQKSMASGAARPNQVCGYDRFAMARLERVQRSQP